MTCSGGRNLHRSHRRKAALQPCLEEKKLVAVDGRIVELLADVLSPRELFLLATFSLELRGECSLASVFSVAHAVDCRAILDGDRILMAGLVPP